MRCLGPIKAWRDERGTSAIEFAIVGPVFIALVIGAIYLCMALFALGSLHYAVEEGARCASIQPTIGGVQQCTSSTNIVSYTQGKYFGPSTAPTFTYAALTCGNSVSGSLNYVVNLGVKQVTVPMTATSCFP